MRLSDMMQPARSLEEAAMMTAKARTLSKGAALKMVRDREMVMDEKIVEQTAQEIQNAAPQVGTASETLAERPVRAALYHVLRHSF